MKYSKKSLFKANLRNGKSKRGKRGKRLHARQTIRKGPSDRSILITGKSGTKTRRE